MAVYWGDTDFQRAVSQYSSINFHILGIGDSWFFYTDEHHTGNLLLPLNQSIGERYNIVALGECGATAVDLANNRRTNYLFHLQEYVKTYRTIKAVIISAGGNDFTGSTLSNQVLNKGKPINSLANCYKDGQPDHVFDKVIESYHQIIDKVISTVSDHNITVFLHNYDYAIPDGRRAELGLIKFGPWLQDPLKDCGVKDFRLGREICRSLIDSFGERLKKLERKSTSRVKVKFINTAGQLEDSEWANELHPTKEGFAKLAKACWKDPLLETLV